MARMMAMICVADRERARAFYGDVLAPVFGLGAPRIDHFGDQFPCGEGWIRLTALPDWQAGQYPVLGWQVHDAAAAAQALVAAGVTMLRYPGFDQDDLGLWTSPDGGARIGWFNDSEGNLLSLTQQG
ncbi:MAG: VOC family protein [Alphaproteobacteria bacterium]|nr:VOC family protein [Alphaproteobacteria bacterium]